MNEEVWDPWLTLSSAPPRLFLFLTYSLPFGAHGPAQPLPPSPSPDTAATVCAQVCPGACAQVWGRSGLGEAPSSILVHSGYQVHPGAEVATP